MLHCVMGVDIEGAFGSFFGSFPVKIVSNELAPDSDSRIFTVWR